MNIFNKQSVVISVNNDDAVLEKMYQAVVPVVESLPCEYELLFVNDGSKDATWELISKYAEEEEQIEGLCLSRNRRHQNALFE